MPRTALLALVLFVLAAAGAQAQPVLPVAPERTIYASGRPDGNRSITLFDVTAATAGLAVQVVDDLTGLALDVETGTLYARVHNTPTIRAFDASTLAPIAARDMPSSAAATSTTKA